MKLILALVRDSDSDLVSQALTSASFRITRIASTGGLLRRGVTTFLIGVEDGQVDAAIQLMKEKCSPVEKEGEKRVTIFVVGVEKFTQV
jgi:uncharacterized protein YaaQ